ncbi:threonine ammonia-lyase [Albimonas pacifica]|uniref:Threonine dehydratase n=1 Tax=Albimonas pacifica TaxID=1114924 RepID=A0A1I3BQG7_9RHOB|nr:threonine/serine dehydratase [Albimonas pacifica]SFH64031.1 threonine dehydratase [Albimonas pacifica]
MPRRASAPFPSPGRRILRAPADAAAGGFALPARTPPGFARGRADAAGAEAGLPHEAAAGSPPIGIDDLHEAAEALRGQAIRTPLLEFDRLNAWAGRRVFLKAESLQRTGSFKVRGAFNRLSRIAPRDRGAGVVAWSSGNHAQGVAAAARLLEMPATIVMPADAPAIKLRNTRALGAEVVLYDRRRESREAIARLIAQTRGATLVPSYDDPLVMAGQGTVGLEIAAQVSAAGGEIGQVLVPCGGGGLIAGVATAMHAEAPGARVHPVEPADHDDTARSLAAGRRRTARGGAPSICDALLAPTPGALTFEVNRRLLSHGLSVDDETVRATMRFAFEALKLALEPGGAVALAALLSGAAPRSEGDVVVVLSGGNVDAGAFARILSDAPRPRADPFS